MFKMFKRILQSALGLSKAAVRVAIQGSGTASLYLCTSTLLAGLLLTAYLTYAWNIDARKWYRALAILQGIEVEETLQAERDRAAEMNFERVLEERAVRLLEHEFQREVRQGAFSLPPPPEEPIPEPPSEPSDGERIGAYERRVQADLAQARSAGLAEQTQLIENMIPDQAKEVIRRLWQENPQRVLQILMDMEERSRQRILYAMRESNDAELKDLCEILQRIGDGDPMTSIIDQASQTPGG